ncbi:MAG TPA: hypothetical protein VN894_21685, partial [Polyangiaceae bacterium]|nr:hypothetical protein [Polyangiaceae bacterium]
MEAFDQDVLILRRSSFMLAAAASPAAVGAVLACTGRSSAVAMMGAALGWLALGLIVRVWTRNPAPRGRRVRATADARGLFVDGRLVLESSRIRAGWLQPRSFGAPRVHLRARGAVSTIDLAVRSLEAGRALLRALAVDPTRVSAQYWTMALPLGDGRALVRASAAITLVLVFGVMAGHATPAALALSVVALIVLLVGAAVPTRVTVGADGVLVEWLGTMRFVRWSSVADIESFERGVVLALATGEWLTLRTPTTDGRHHPERDEM